MQHIVVPTFIRHARDVPGGAIVGQNQAVRFKRLQNHLNVGGKARNIVVGAQAQAQAHGRVVGASQVRSIMTGWPDVGRLRLRRGKANGVANFTSQHLIVAHQPRQDGQPRRIGRGPAIGPQIMRIKVIDGPIGRFPTAVPVGKGIKHFVQQAVISV